MHAGLPDFSEMPIEYYDENELLFGPHDFYTNHYNDGSKIIVGHVPTKFIDGATPHEIFHINDTIAIDCGCGFGGQLGVLWKKCIFRKEHMNMLYSKDIKKAMNLAYNAHDGQLDKSGYPYIAHPLHVAEKMSDEASTIIALLHDIVEDTSVTFEQLENLGFKTDVITALKLLTHDDNISYFDYINNMKDNSLAKQVKIADLEHNMELSRLDVITEKDIRRAEKYRKALNILKSL